MKFSIERKAFLDKLNVVSRAISPNSPKPILSGIYFNATQDCLELVGSEVQLSIQSLIYPDEKNRLHVEEPGKLVVEAKYLNELVRKMDGEILHFETVDKSVLQIQVRSNVYSLRILPASEYPLPDFKKPDLSFELDARILREIVSQVAFAASEKDIRKVLLGVHFEAENGKLICAATDSYRLAKKVLYLDNLPDFEINVPVKALNEVVRSLKEDEKVYIHCDSKKIQFLYDDNLIQSTLYEGTYPAIDRIIPTSFNSTLVARADQLKNILDISLIYLSERVSVVRMECDENQAIVYSSSVDVGSSDQLLDEMSFEGKPIRISFNGLFMQQALQGLECKDKVKLQFIGELKPIRITNPDNENLEMIVVPLRTH